MRSPLPALHAFTRDAETPVSSSGATDRIYDVMQADAREDALARWLGVAKAAERLVMLSPKQRERYLAQVAGDLLPPSDARPTQVHDVEPAPEDATGRLAERIRVHAEDMERAGCFELAYTTVSAVCQLAAHGSLTTRLLATMQLGRIARQLGELDTADDCYRQVTDEALKADDGPLAAIGYLGRGNLSRVRGNRPLERDMFERALTLAHAGGAADVQASQGLMNVALSQHRLVDALLHGWRAFDLSSENSETRAMILSNLALASLQADFAEAALKGFKHTLTLTDSARIRLPAIGGAMRAASRLREYVEVSLLNESGDRESALARIPFETARFLMYAGEAWATIGDKEFARRRYRESLALAKAQGFNEIMLTVEFALERLDVVVVPAPPNLTAAALIDGENGAAAVGIGRLEALTA